MTRITATNGYIYSYATGRGIQVKQVMKCFTHKKDFTAIPLAVQKIGIGCDLCKIDLALNGVVFSPWSETIANAFMKAKARFPHVLYDYCGKKTSVSIFKCTLTNKRFKSTLIAETGGGKTGCTHCKKLLETDRRKRTQSAAFSRGQALIKQLHSKGKHLNISFTDEGLSCKDHGLFRTGWSDLTRTKDKLKCPTCYGLRSQPEYRQHLYKKCSAYVKTLSNLKIIKNNKVTCVKHSNFVKNLSWFAPKMRRNCLLCKEDHNLKIRLEKLYSLFPKVVIKKILEHDCHGIVFKNNMNQTIYWKADSLLLVQKDNVYFRTYTNIERPQMLNDAIKATYTERILAKHPKGINVKFNIDPSNKLRIKCKHTCGNIWETNVHNLISSKVGCPECGRRQAASAVQLSPKAITERIKAKRLTYEFVSQSKTMCTLRCIICNAEKTVLSYTAHHTPCSCQSMKGPRSKIAFCWLEEIKKIYKIELQGSYGTKEKEISLNDKIIKVDGYHKETKTIFEFFGDYYHGNPKVYPKMKDKYDESLLRLSELNYKGYNIVYVWESDYAKQGKITSGYMQGRRNFPI